MLFARSNFRSSYQKLLSKRTISSTMSQGASPNTPSFMIAKRTPMRIFVQWFGSALCDKTSATSSHYAGELCEEDRIPDLNAATGRLRLYRLDPVTVTGHVVRFTVLNENTHLPPRSRAASLCSRAATPPRSARAAPQGFATAALFSVCGLPFGALDHPFPPNQVAKPIHIVIKCATEKHRKSPRFSSYGSGETLSS
jgi:hypothetical protein